MRERWRRAYTDSRSEVASDRRSRPGPPSRSPCHACSPARDVLVYLGSTRGRVPRRAGRIAFAQRRDTVPGVRTGLAALIGPATSGSPGGPGPGGARLGGSDVVAVASDVAGTRSPRCASPGPTPTTSTAGMPRLVGDRAAHGQIEAAGALGPVEAFGLAALRDGCEDRPASTRPERFLHSPSRMIHPKRHGSSAAGRVLGRGHGFTHGPLPASSPGGPRPPRFGTTFRGEAD